MAFNPRIPTYHELIDLSNHQLTECLRQALREFHAAQQRGDDAKLHERVYWAYQEERLKRLNLGKRRRLIMPQRQSDQDGSRRSG